jgi:hypothetical protein
MRRFYNIDATYTFDWPNYQYAYPWRLWLDKYEMAAQPTKVVTGTYLPSPVVISPSEYFLQPINSGPPFTSLELRRDTSAAFGSNTTPQNDIGITGTFGYWNQLSPAGDLTAAISSVNATTIMISDGSLIGAGDVLTIDSERMLVVDKTMVSTGISWTGISTASAADNIAAVANGTAFDVGEVLLADAERLLIVDISGNNLIVKRAWDGTVLTTHSGGTLYAERQLTVNRGVYGTTATTHSNSAPISIAVIPGLVSQVALGEAIVMLIGSTAGYTAQITPTPMRPNLKTGGQQAEDFPGPGMADLRNLCLEQFGRKARSRVV